MRALYLPTYLHQTNNLFIYSTLLLYFYHSSFFIILFRVSNIFPENQRRIGTFLGGEVEKHILFF